MDRLAYARLFVLYLRVVKYSLDIPDNHHKFTLGFVCIIICFIEAFLNRVAP